MGILFSALLPIGLICPIGLFSPILGARNYDLLSPNSSPSLPTTDSNGGRSREVTKQEVGAEADNEVVRVGWIGE